MADADGKKVLPASLGMPGWPDETTLTITFEDLDGRTRMTMRHASLPVGPGRDGANAGWSQAFDKLTDYVRKAAATA